MTSSDSGRWLGLATCAALVLVPLELGCVPAVPTGDIIRLGCPEGEGCVPGAVRLQRSAAYGCAAMVADEVAPSSASTAVALGGRTRAGATMYGWFEAPVASSEFSPEFEVEGSDGSATTARAIAVGPGRFTARNGAGFVLDYVSMPVIEPARAVVTDGAACADEPRVLLRGVTTAIAPVVLSDTGVPLVDLGATARTLAGEATVTPSARSERVTFRIRFGEGRELLETLDVVDSIDRVELIRSPLDRLRRGPLVLQGPGRSLCFRAFAGDAAALGASIEDTSVDDEGRGEVEVRVVSGACIHVFQVGTLDDAAPAYDPTIDVTMAGITSRIVMHVPERFAATDE